MRDDQADKLIEAVTEHGNQMQNNMVHEKKFTAGQNREQAEFLSDLQAQNERLQAQAVLAAKAAAGAAIVTAIVAVVEIVLLVVKS